MLQDVRARQPLRMAAAAAPAVAEAATSIAVASTTKAAASALATGDLAAINPILADKFGEIEGRLEELEGGP